MDKGPSRKAPRPRPRTFFHLNLASMSPSPPPLPAWGPLARVHDSSAGVDPGELEPGRDLVLHASGAHGAALAHGVLLDDWLTREELKGSDLQANRNLDGWRRRHDDALTVAGVCLPHVHEGELLATSSSGSSASSPACVRRFATLGPSGSPFTGWTASWPRSSPACLKGSGSRWSASTTRRPPRATRSYSP